MIYSSNLNIVGHGRNNGGNSSRLLLIANKIFTSHIHRDWRGGDLIERVKLSRDVDRIGPVFYKLLESVRPFHLILVFSQLNGG